MKIAIQMVCLLGSLLLLGRVAGDPRTFTVEMKCGKQPQHNTTLFVPNFVAAMDSIGEQMQRSGFGKAVKGSGPDTNYVLAQCYGDLSLLDCVLCYAHARTVLPQCFPYNGGRIFLDGCFMRSENYSFFEEYEGHEDKAVCNNARRKDSIFQELAKAVTRAVASAPNNRGYARAQEKVSGTGNESVYVLADCLRSLNASLCRACLENASASILNCLPWSEGRALKIGCFMRYSDRDFLNKELGNSRSRVFQRAISEFLLFHSYINVVGKAWIRALIAVAATIGIAIILVILFLFFMRWRRAHFEGVPMKEKLVKPCDVCSGIGSAEKIVTCFRCEKARQHVILYDQVWTTLLSGSIAFLLQSFNMSKVYKCDERKEDLKGCTASSSTNASIEVNSSVAGNRNKAAVKLLNTHSNKAALWIFGFIGCRLWYGEEGTISYMIIPGTPASGPDIDIHEISRLDMQNLSFDKLRSELFRLNDQITQTSTCPSTSKTGICPSTKLQDLGNTQVLTPHGKSQNAGAGIMVKTSGTKVVISPDRIVYFMARQVEESSVDMSVYLNASVSKSDCKDICWKNCTCVGTAATSLTPNSTGCQFWYGPLDQEPLTGMTESLYYIIRPGPPIGVQAVDMDFNCCSSHINRNTMGYSGVSETEKTTTTREVSTGLDDIR
ncbi:hypothetical protein EZV62_007544 [Acer yangbiense]|uniref:Gnk2-homologous domain-containing protein n=1 Tax=Acer yangbiense TaxID=1000413 RepID=A0A5C7IBW0_9ROSI|nr:hypothetical protein EZV62_007544 [Acer yangbiense]